MLFKITSVEKFQLEINMVSNLVSENNIYFCEKHSNCR